MISGLLPCWHLTCTDRYVLSPTQSCDNRDTVLCDPQVFSVRGADLQATNFFDQIVAFLSASQMDLDAESTGASESNPSAVKPAPASEPAIDGPPCNQTWCAVASGMPLPVSAMVPASPGPRLPIYQNVGYWHPSAAAGQVDFTRQGSLPKDGGLEKPVNSLATGNTTIGEGTLTEPGNPPFSLGDDSGESQPTAGISQSSDSDSEVGGPVGGQVAGSASPDEPESTPVSRPQPVEPAFTHSNDKVPLVRGRERPAEEEKSSANDWPRVQTLQPDNLGPTVHSCAPAQSADLAPCQGGHSTVAEGIIAAPAGHRPEVTATDGYQPVRPSHPSQQSEAPVPGSAEPVALHVVLTESERTANEGSSSGPRDIEHSAAREAETISKGMVLPARSPEIDPLAPPRAHSSDRHVAPALCRSSNGTEVRAPALPGMTLRTTAPVAAGTGDRAPDELSAGNEGPIAETGRQASRNGQLSGPLDRGRDNTASTRPPFSTRSDTSHVEGPVAPDHSSSFESGSHQEQGETEPEQLPSVQEQHPSTGHSKSPNEAASHPTFTRAATGEARPAAHLTAPWSERSAGVVLPESATHSEPEVTPSVPLPDPPAEAVAAPGASVRKVEFTVAHPESGRPVSLEMIDRGGDVLVSVRTGDGPLRNELQRHVGELIDRLERSGYTAETVERTTQNAGPDLSRARSQDLHWKDGGQGGQRRQGDQQAYRQWMEETHENASRRRT